MSTWSLTDAKAKFEDLCEKAKNEAPQTITRYGKPVAVVVSAHEFEAWQARREPPWKASNE